MTYVTSQFFPCIFLAPSQKPSFSKMATQKVCGHDNLFVGLLSILVRLFSGISDNLINFWDESIENKMAGSRMRQLHAGRYKFSPVGQPAVPALW